MMTMIRKWKRRTKIAFIATLALVAYMLIAWWTMMKPPARYDSVNWPEKRWVIERMQFHGIYGCTQDAEGYYFIRAGKRCRL